MNNTLSPATGRSKRAIAGVPGVLRGSFVLPAMLAAWMVAPIDVRAQLSFTRVSSGEIATDEQDSQGLTWADVNGDDREDLFVANYHGQPDALYLNNGDGTFTKIIDQPPVQAGTPSLAASFGDVNNDGHPDLYVAGVGQARLYLNDGDGTWTELLDEPISQSSLVHCGAAWGDFNGDGLLDLAVATGGGAAAQQNLLYRNLGGGQFVRIEDGPAATSTGYNISASWADYDNDGGLDLLFTGENFLFRNNGGAGFAQLTTTPVSNVTGFPSGGAWADYDNDGRLDLMIVNLGSVPRLYRNLGGNDLELVDVPAFAAIGNTAGMAWGDFDNDGFIDVAMARRNDASVLFRNLGPGGFEQVPPLGLPAAALGNALSWTDFDADGFLDLFIARGGDTGAVNNQPNDLLHNSGNGNHWLKVRLRGNQSNRDGIGAKVRVTASFGGNTSTQLRQVGGGDSYGGNLTFAHFGLGNATTIDEVHVEWPSGTVQTFNDIAINQQLNITESDAVSLAQVIPPGLEDTDGNYYAGTLHEPQIRLQVVYGAVNFPARPMAITELRFRRDINEPPFNTVTAAAAVKLSTTMLSPGGLGATFAENAGPDETLVFDGTWTYSSTSEVNPGTVRPFDIVLPLSTPFLYNPAAGNLLFDIRLTANSGANWTDGVSGGEHHVSRVISLNADALTGDAGEPTGDVIQFIYRTVDALELLPSAGTFTNSVEVSIFSGTPTGVIRYTTDGEDPTESSAQYLAPLTLTQTTTVKARLYVNGFPASEIVEATYVIYFPPDIQFDPAGRLFTNQLSVSLVNNVGAGTIRYTSDGSPVVGTSPAYPGAFNLTAGATIRARVFLNAFPISEEFQETYARVYTFADDGVPFAWRELHFGPGFLTDPDAAAAADPDQDGYTNAEEYASGTLPGDGESAPEILLTVRVVPELTFTTLPGRSYRIDRTTTLNPPDWQTIVESVLATGAELHYVDEEAPDNSFYRIVLIHD